MHFTDHMQQVFGAADRADVDAPVVHRHDDFELASEEDLAQFEVETDSEGHHYGTRKPHAA
ncbi:hypothetical protein IV498_15435 [Paenarthrobacter sp. Z7-10]|uniref:hypothetical protein n=1 Tax=Paenarthrobacter sp. Z7-10 TaxID=2787635 RepID=UPI0022A9D58A|nr:hypothetical protein [Paenarthrobacter sp. Z7-10]MCZ2404534.1 hypothetical protein [Paenarthrobacter sp. Z7-10]